jgi:hydroxysqualene dehydroxylase
MKSVAVIGAGWAGAASALTLARAGVKVTVFEAAKSAGGRARVIEKDGRYFDNGQHLLLGAYEQSLAMIASLHQKIDDVVLRMPLALNTAPGHASPLHLHAPRIVAPLHLLVAIASARGLGIADKISTLKWAARHLRGALLSIDDCTTVAELLVKQPEPARQLLWEPLCIAALNTPPITASARVFLNVLKQAFTGSARASDLIIPRVDLSQLLPVPALAEACRLGGELRLGQAVNAVRQTETAVTVETREATHNFCAAVIATGPQHVSRLLENTPEQHVLGKALSELEYEPITTLYFEFAHVPPCVTTGMLMLDGNPGQWLFWQRLPSGHWRASVVISAHHRREDEIDLHANTLAQLRHSYTLPTESWHMSITEKRATYACTPKQSALLATFPKQFGQIFFAGDWCFPSLPATLEAAVISGANAAQLILATH